MIVKLAKWELAHLDDALLRELVRSCPAIPPDNPTDSTDPSRRRYGSGFFVSKQGHILTNNHVVEGCKTLMTRDGKPLTVVDRDVRADLAIVQANVTPEAIAVFRRGTTPKTGEPIVVFGFPLPGILSDEGNVSTGVLSASAGLANDVRVVQISAPVQPGASGGPVLDASGHVIGVVEARLDALAMARVTGALPENVNFAVHWAGIRAFLEQNCISYREAPSTHPTQTQDIAISARRFSVGIVCTK